MKNYEFTEVEFKKHDSFFNDFYILKKNIDNTLILTLANPNKYIFEYYAKLSTLASGHYPYLAKETRDLGKDFDKLFYDKNFLQHLKLPQVSPKVIEVLFQLKDFYQKILDDLEHRSIMPKAYNKEVKDKEHSMINKRI